MKQKIHFLIHNMIVIGLLAACQTATPAAPTKIPTIPPPATSTSTNTALPTNTSMPTFTTTATFTNTATPTKTLIPTPTPIVPKAGALFSGSFKTGYFTFKISDDGKSVILMTIELTGCKKNPRLSFSGGKTDPIENGQFEIVIKSSKQTNKITGVFDTPTSAHGIIDFYLNESCIVRPTEWTATSK